VPLTRQRTWIEKDDPEKLAAYHSLWTVLRGLSILMAPITPHMCEDIYRNLVTPFSGVESVHLESWLKPDESFIDSGLEAEMDVVKKFSEAVASAREKTGIKRRWPLQSIIFKPVETGFGTAVEGMLELVMAQANAKEITLTDTLSNAVNSNPERYNSFESELGVIIIDTERSDEIIREGYGRELVRRIQQMRKDLDLNVETFIEVNVEIDDEKLPQLIKDQSEYIEKETRTKGLYINEQHKKTKKTWEIEGKRFIISIEE
jgi:isoleucyl-tRNA synthetase